MKLLKSNKSSKSKSSWTTEFYIIERKNKYRHWVREDEDTDLARALFDLNANRIFNPSEKFRLIKVTKYYGYFGEKEELVA